MKLRFRLSRGALVTIALAVLTGVGIVGYLGFGYPPWVAVSMTLLTLTTVGFAPGSHLSTGELVFTAGLAFLGVGLFFVILALAAAAIVEGRVSLFSRSRRMRRRLDQLHTHFIVCAYGRVGRAVAGELAAGHVPFVVVDSDAGLKADLDQEDRCYLIGDASDEAVLREAGIERAQGLICAVDSDAENVFITIVARSLSQDLLIVARAAREQSADRLYRAGATHVVSPYATSGRGWRPGRPAARGGVLRYRPGRASRPAAGGAGDHRGVPAGGPDHQGTAQAACRCWSVTPTGSWSPARPATCGCRPATCWSSSVRPRT